MLKHYYTNRSFPKYMLFLVLGMPIYSCVFSKWRVEMFSPQYADQSNIEPIWFTDAHGGASRESQNDLLYLSLGETKKLNLILMAKPTQHQGKTSGVLMIPLFPTSILPTKRFYTPDDPNLQIGVAYDDLTLMPGEDCFRVQENEKVFKGEVKHLSARRSGSNEIDWNVKTKKGKVKFTGLFEIRFPLDPYSIAEFRLLSCSLNAGDQKIVLPEIAFKKSWQDRSWAGP